MIALIQRVSQAQVAVREAGTARICGAIEAGILALVAVQPHDSAVSAEKLLEKMLNYRVFYDDSGRMNLSLRDTGGGLLLVSQFTLAADTRKGTRASFTSAAAPDVAAGLFADFVSLAAQRHPVVASGVFGADMQVSLTNDGPVTFWLEV